MRLLLIVPVLALALATASSATSAQSAPESSRATLTVRNSQFGKILFDGRGFALYAFTKDRRGGRSTCYGACAKAWPPYVVRGALSAGPGTQRSLLRTVRRRDGSLQATYAGRPLYYYVGDKRAGQVLCQNVSEFGGLWLVVRASGQLVR
jgi:predicted lipoprotein with Yx(FWY)xxD motif